MARRLLKSCPIRTGAPTRSSLRSGAMETPSYKILTPRKLRQVAAAKARDRAHANAGAKPDAVVRRPTVVLLERPADDYAGLDWCLGDECR